MRISIDAKATVNLGPFSRGGKSRVAEQALDHDFKTDQHVTPVGILLPASNELFVYGVTSKVTSDCIVDCLYQWWSEVSSRFGSITTLVINLDNGPENHSRRSQFMQRLVEFVRDTGLCVQLAYYPPYHSKYNPIERCWGVLEQHWNGSLLDNLHVALEYIKTMTWRGVRPVVRLVTKLYRKGVKLSKDAMQALERCFSRDPHLGKWFVSISPDLLPG